MAQYQTQSRIQISFDDNKRRILENNLRTFIVSIKSGNLLVGFHVSPPLLVFCSLINISGISDDELKASLAFKAGVNLQSIESPTLEDFFEFLGNATREYLEKPHLEYHLLFPINLKREKIPNIPIVINNISFEIHEWQNVQERYDISSLIDGVRKYIEFAHEPIYWNNSSTPLIAKLYGRNAEEVFRKCEVAYDLYISFLNFFLDGSTTVQLSRPSPLTSVVPPVGYGVFLPDGKLECPYININHLNYQSLCQKGVDDQKIQNLIDKSNSPTDADIRLIEAIKSHNLGLETMDWEYSFLAFWRVFEILAFGNRIDYNMNAVIDRVCILIGANSDGIKEFLRLCAQHRNSFVHRGSFPIKGQPLVLALKYFSTVSIMRFLRISGAYPKESLIDEYFAFAKSPTPDLLERKIIIESILAERNP